MLCRSRKQRFVIVLLFGSKQGSSFFTPYLNILKYIFFFHVDTIFQILMTQCIKLGKRGLENSTHLLKCSRLALIQHRLSGVGVRYIFMPESSLLYGFLLIDLYLLRSFTSTMPLTILMSSAISLASSPL